MIEARQNWRLDSETTFNVRVSGQWLDFGEPAPRDLEVFNIGSGLSTRLSGRLAFNNSFGWRNEDDSVFGRTEGLWLTSELKYDYRQIHFTAGLELNELDRRDDRIDGMLLYFRLKRLF